MDARAPRAKFAAVRPANTGNLVDGEPGAAPIRAGGSLPQRPDNCALPLSRRLRLIGEIGLIFVLAPLAMRTAVHDLGIPLFVALAPVLIGVASS